MTYFVYLIGNYKKSRLITYKFCFRSHRLRVRTVGFQSTNRGSNPRGTAKYNVKFNFENFNY